MCGLFLKETLFIIKPDAVAQEIGEKILSRVKNEGFKILELKNLTLSKESAGKFYLVHKGKPFYLNLIEFISSGRIIVCRLQRSDAVKKLREVVGATDPKDAEPGTLRKLFGTSICQNAVHASDSLATAKEELKFFFGE